MLWLTLLSACLHPPPKGPTPAAQAQTIHPALEVETKRSLVGLSILIEGGSASDDTGKEGAGALMWESLSTHPALVEWKEAGGQFRSEWHRDYGVLHYRWAASKDLSDDLKGLLNTQLISGEDIEALTANLELTRTKWDREEADRGLPSLRDSWLQIGLTGHPYAHPKRGSSATRSQLTPADLQDAWRENLCTGRVHLAWADSETSAVPDAIRDSLNELDSCKKELPTPKPFPISNASRLLILESRGAGTQAFLALPHRPTSQPLDPDTLQWGASLLTGQADNGPVQQAMHRASIEAMVSARLSERGERWRQPLLQLEVRTQDADPIALFDALHEGVSNLHQNGWTRRDLYRSNQHLSHREEPPHTSPRVESLLLAETFGLPPKASPEIPTESILEFLLKGIQLEHPIFVMEVGNSEALAAHASGLGFEVKTLRAIDLVTEATD